MISWGDVQTTRCDTYEREGLVGACAVLGSIRKGDQGMDGIIVALTSRQNPSVPTDRNRQRINVCNVFASEQRSKPMHILAIIHV